jgi:hypothetical protein
MPAVKQYFFDPERAKDNKKILQFRRGKKWKQLELLDTLRREESPENSLFGTLIPKYRDIQMCAEDEEVRELVRGSIKSASIKSREALGERFSREVIWGPTDKLVPSKIEEGKSSINLVTYDRMRTDIRRKGITTPLLVTDSYEIIDGHIRHLIAKELKLDQIPYMIVYIKTLPEHAQYRIITDLRFGNNLGRTQIPKKDSKALTRIWKTFLAEKRQPGAPTLQELRLKREMKTKSLTELVDSDRHLVRLYGLHKIKKVPS